MTLTAVAVLALWGIAAGMIPVMFFLPLVIVATKRRAEEVEAETATAIAIERNRRLSWQLNAEHEFWLQQRTADARARDVASYRAWRATRGGA